MKKLQLVFVIFLVLSLTGCIQRYQLTEKQEDSTAEYMAGLLLKNDTYYKSTLIPLEDYKGNDNSASAGQDKEGNSSNNVTVTPTPTSTPAPTKEASSSNQQAASDKNSTLSEVIGSTDFDIQYKEYKLCDTYPEDKTSTYFSLSANPGKQLLVTSFSLKNLANKANTLNLTDSTVDYLLADNAGITYKPLLTLLQNDLQYINVNLDAGKTETVLLVFEVSKNLDMNNINLIASKGEKSDIIEIK